MTLTRDEAIMEAIAIAQADMLPGDEAEIVSCVGEPTCRLRGRACRRAQRKGCPHCIRITVGERLARA